MLRCLLPILWICLLAAAPTAPARTIRCPLAPASLGGADIFTTAEAYIAQAATAAKLPFVSDPRPLLPQVIVTLDTQENAVQKRNALLLWRGDMLPDQLAPAETGTLIRKRRTADGTWKTTRTRENFSYQADHRFIPQSRLIGSVHLPMIIETPYQLGTLDNTPVQLVLWRTAEEDSVPLGGFIALQDPPPAFLAALETRLLPFEGQADWAAEFDALSP